MFHRLWNDNEKISTVALDEAIRAAHANLSSTPWGQPGNDWGGAVIHGLRPSAAGGNNVDVNSGAAIFVDISPADNFDSIHKIAANPEFTATTVVLTPPIAGDTRIALITAKISIDTDTPQAVPIRDPIGGTVDPASPALDTRERYRIGFTITNTTQTAVDWVDLDPPTVPANEFPIALAYMTSAGVQTVVDARPFFNFNDSADRTETGIHHGDPDQPNSFTDWDWEDTGADGVRLVTTTSGEKPTELVYVREGRGNLTPILPRTVVSAIEPGAGSTWVHVQMKDGALKAELAGTAVAKPTDPDLSQGTVCGTALSSGAGWGSFTQPRDVHRYRWGFGGRENLSWGQTSKPILGVRIELDDAGATPVVATVTVVDGNGVALSDSQMQRFHFMYEVIANSDMYPTNLPANVSSGVWSGTGVAQQLANPNNTRGLAEMTSQGVATRSFSISSGSDTLLLIVTPVCPAQGGDGGTHQDANTNMQVGLWPYTPMGPATALIELSV